MGDMNFPDPNTTTEHDGYEWDGEKWIKQGSSGVSDWADIENKPTEFPPADHTHEIAEVNGLQDELDTIGSGGGAWELLSTTTASNSTTVDIEDFSSTYDEYKIIITNLNPSTNNSDFKLRFKGSGSYLDTSTHDSYYFQSTSSSNTPSGNGSLDDCINLARPMHSTQNPNFFEISIFDANNTSSDKGVTFNAVLKNGYAYTSFGVGTAGGTKYALQGARFFFNAGTIKKGTFKLYGIKKT